MPRMTFPVAVHLFLIKDNKILLLRRFNTGYEDGNYSVVAGHIDGGEDVFSAMIREAKEEAGIDVVLENLEIVQVMHRKKENEERIDYFFKCEKWNGTIEIIEPDKCDEFVWVELDKLPKNTVNYVNEAINNYKKNIKFSLYGWKKIQAPHVEIETSRLILRPLTEADVATVRLINGDEHKTDEAAIEFIRWQSNPGRLLIQFYIWLRQTNQCIGRVYIHAKPEINNEVEIGYGITEQHRNQGYATEAAKAAVWYAFEQAGQEVLSAIVKPENTASRRVIEKLGFISGGVRTVLDDDGEYFDFDYFRLYHTDYLPGPEWDKSITALKGEFAMTDQEKFAGFKQKLIDENEQRYGKEIRANYGDTAVDESNANIKGLTKEQYDKGEQLRIEIEEALKAAFETGDPAGELAQKACDLHKQWLCIYNPKYSKEYHIGLGEMYVADERFRANYDKLAPGCTAFLRDAINIFCLC